MKQKIKSMMWPVVVLAAMGLLLGGYLLVAGNAVGIPTQLQPHADGTVSVLFQGTPGSAYQIQAARTIAGGWNVAASNVVARAGWTEWVETNVQASNQRFYQVVAMNNSNTNSSNPATVTTAQPTNQTVNVGGTATFTVTVSGTGPFTYQWYFGSTALANATNATLSLNNVQTANAGIYYVVVSNAAGSVTSSYAALRVFSPSSVVVWGNLWNQGTPPDGLTGVVAVAAGNYHTLALKSDGTVVGWGDDTYGQTDVPSSLTNGVVAIAAGGYQSLALKSDGTVVGWGGCGYGEGTPPAGLTGVVAIAAGFYYSLALKSDGTVVGWGYNGDGETTTAAGLTNVVAIAAGSQHGLALKNNGTVVSWGWNHDGQTNLPAGLTGVVAIACGTYHCLAVKSDGTVVGWGNNQFGQATVPAGLTGVVAAAAGTFHSLTLKSDGTVFGWGNNGSGQATPPVGLTNVVAIAAGNARSLALMPPVNQTIMIDVMASGVTTLSNAWGLVTLPLVLTNTQPDILYEIQGSTNLLQNNWISEGFVYGSELTNWTPTSLQVNQQGNLFLKIRSWADGTGSGIPDWWWLEYFGQTTNVDAYADPAGDGWNNLEKFQNGMNPNQFYTPPAPQGVTVSYNPTNGMATVSWLPSPGAVTNYTVNFNGTIYHVSAGQNSFTAALSLTPYNIWRNGPSVYTSFEVQADYAGGNSPQGSTSLALNYPDGIFATPGPQGSTCLVVPPSTLPPGTTAIRLTRIDVYAERNYGNSSFDTNWVISLSAFTNGLYLIPAFMQTAPVDSYGQSSYRWWVETVDANGVANSLDYPVYNRVDLGNPFYNDYWDQTDSYYLGGKPWLMTPYFDGRAQLKQNLIFLLRAGLNNMPFQFTELHTNNLGPLTFTYFTNYAYAGFYTFDFTPDYPPTAGVCPFLPFGENYLYRNFVFNVSDADPQSGLLTSFTNSWVSYYHDLGLSEPPTYQFQPPTTNGVSIPSLLATNQARWLLLYLSRGYNPSPAGIQWIGPTNKMLTNIRNTFGLDFLSTKVSYGTGGVVQTTVLYPGDSTTQGGYSAYFYSETAQPQFQTAEYDFWNPNLDSLPGMTDYFSTANASSLMIAGMGDPNFQVAGYAKLAIQNGYSGKYAYLGQYFTNAYQIDTNGNVTTNTTGILSPYGYFFPTNPGPVALVTMPDIDTGARGTCTVYCVSLALDKNSDGNMDLSFNGPDATSQVSPMIAWANNNFDRFTTDADDGVQYDDDVKIGGDFFTPNTPVPDYNFKDAAGHRVIPCARDLLDFFRLWVCGIDTNLIAKLPAGSTITLNWGDVGSPNSGNPTIDLFKAADSDGGIGYLTNSTTAVVQTIEPYIGRLGPGQSIQLNAATFANHWAGNYFIMCGVSNGTGGLNLTIADGSGNVLAQTTTYLQIVDIKQMYERWTIGDTPSIAPKTNAVPASEDLPPFTTSFQYTPPQDTNTPYILFVHGWNMERWEKDRFAESAFKRLYWQGYQGRFGSFRWPTYNGFTGSFWQALTDTRNFDNSEFIAWQSAAGLLNKLKDLNAEYPGHVYMLAHSMGNVVAGEALRLAGNNQVVKTYVASQAALPAHNYDAAVTTPYLLQFNYHYPSGPLWALGTMNYGPDTPNIYGNRLTNNAAAGRRVNFYNQNDFALAAPRWCFDEITKPDYIPPNNYYYYNGSLSDPAPWNKFKDSPIVGDTGVLVDIVTNLNNRYKIMSYAAESYSTALGATPGITTFDDRLDLTAIWPADSSGHSYADHFWHSAQFRGDYWQEQNYWNTLLRSGSKGFNISNP